MSVKQKNKYLYIGLSVILLSACASKLEETSSSSSFNNSSFNDSSINYSSSNIENDSSIKEEDSTIEQTSSIDASSDNIQDSFENSTISNDVSSEELISQSTNSENVSSYNSSSSSSLLIINEDNVMEYILDNLKSVNSFKLITTGTTKATGYNQKTNTTLYATQGAIFSEMSSTSSLVNHSHNVLVNKDIIKYKDSDNKDIIETDYSTYQSEYGVIPSIDTIFSFDVTKESIASTSIIETNQGYTIDLVLDNEKSSKDLGIQMKRFGGLKKEPTFKEIKLVLNVDNNYKILDFTSTCSYKITKQVTFINMDMNCSQELTSTFVYEDISLNEIIKF